MDDSRMYLMSQNELANYIAIKSETKKKPTFLQKKKVNGYLNRPNFCEKLNRDQAEILLNELEHRVRQKMSRGELYLNAVNFDNHPESQYALWKLNQMLDEVSFYETKATTKQRDYIYTLMNLTPMHAEIINEVNQLNKQQAMVLIDAIKSGVLIKHLQTSKFTIGGCLNTIISNACQFGCLLILLFILISVIISNFK